MSGSLARMALKCSYCEHRFDALEAPVEAALLHMQVEHDTDEVRLELVAVCECGATMGFISADPIPAKPGRARHQFRCPACQRAGSIEGNAP